MSMIHRNHVHALIFATSLAACTGDAAPGQSDPSRSPPALSVASGTVGTLQGRATFSDPANPVFRVARMTGDWRFALEAEPAFDLAVQTIAFDPGGQSGWHSHPGPVFIQVVSGTMTFYESHDPTCSPTVVQAGQGYLDHGEHAHIARNESAEPAQNVVTYFVPPGVPLRIDQPIPGNCPF